MPATPSTAATSKGVNLAPHPAALIESLRSIGYTLDTALADICKRRPKSAAG